MITYCPEKASITPKIHPGGVTPQQNIKDILNGNREGIAAYQEFVDNFYNGLEIY